MRPHLALCVALSASFAVVPGLAQDGENGPGGLDSLTLEDVVVVGTRIRGVAEEDLAVPVDVYDVQELGRAASKDLTVALQKTAPSFNSKRNALGDGGLFHTATLRGMSPDHTLLLVNGKRRHSISFPRPLDVAGQGTTGADLRSIPVAAIERIEILRDGAAAQYGSDAIGGVINVVLKETPYESTLGLNAGVTDEGDGERIGASVGLGLPLGDEGSVNLTAEFHDQGPIDRAFETSARDPNGPNAPGVRRKIVLGEPEHDLKSLFVNAVATLDSGGELYAFGGLSSRNGRSSGAWRDPLAMPDRMVAPVHPDGFLPFEVSVSDDQAVSAGFRSVFRNWDYDASLSYGVNEFNFGAEDSINASWAASWLKNQLKSRDLADITPREVTLNAGPTSGDSGGTKLSHVVLDFDVSGPVGDASEAAVGAQLREEQFRMRAGDEASYLCGTPDHPGEAPAVTLVDGAVGQLDRLARCGHQGYPGYSPVNARFAAKDRSSHALWADLRHDVSSDWNVEVAARYESYEGAGESFTGMIGSRYRLASDFSLRATASTGFRAPSLPQLGFNTIVFGGGSAADGGLSVTAHLEDGAAHNFFGFGPETLGHEESRNVSAGVAWDPGIGGLSLSADVYLIEVKDRITLLQRTPDCSGALRDQCTKLVTERQLPRITKIQFFDNALDTRTTGLDVVAEHRRAFASGDLTLTGALHFNRTRITAANDGVGEPTRSFVERGNPRQRHRIHASWTDGEKYDLDIGVNYFGKSAPQWLSFSSTCPGEISPAWIADASVGFRLRDGVRFTLGASNLLDEYPDEIQDKDCADLLNATLGWGVRYNPDTSYGLSGRIWYSRLDVTF